MRSPAVAARLALQAHLGAALARLGGVGNPWNARRQRSSLSMEARLNHVQYDILELGSAGASIQESAAELLVCGFRESAPDAWPTLDAAWAEVATALAPDRLAFVAAAGGVALGWIGAIPSYGSTGWELHPLVVRPHLRRRGIGRALVAHLAAAVTQCGGCVLYLGTDDETGRTSLWGVDLFPGVLSKLLQLCDVDGHPFRFYERCGFEVVGIVPDANGFGRPDILMARRCAPAPMPCAPGAERNANA